MVLNSTPEQQAQYRALNRLRMKAYRDKKRVRKYSPHPTVLKNPNGCVQQNKEGKTE